MKSTGIVAVLAVIGIVAMGGLYVSALSTEKSTTQTQTLTQSVSFTATQTSVLPVLVTQTQVVTTTFNYSTTYTNTVFLSTTDTSTQTTTQTSTTTVYPIPSNVTIYFTYESGNFNYQIEVNGESVSNGAFNSCNTSPFCSLSVPVTQLYQGETLDVTLSSNNGGFSYSANGAMYLYVNGAQVATGSVTNSQSSMQYTV